MNFKVTAPIFLLLVVSSALVSTNAYAYLDPGTGSMVLQALIAGILGSFFAIKMYWQKIRNFFSKTPVQPADDNK